MKPEEDFAGRKNVGRRPYQEDTYAFCTLKDRSALLAVISDGMGGHSAGDLASEAAVGGFVHHCLRQPPEVPLPDLLGGALAAANRAVGKVAARQETQAAGCTLTAVILQSDGTVLWTSVGDSPLMVFQNDRLYRLNKDHSMRAVLATKLLRGEISREEFDGYKGKSALLSALTGEALAEVDAPACARTLEKGAIILAATDGILNLDPLEISGICRECGTGNASRLADQLIHHTLAKGHAKQDNVTVAVIKPPHHPTP
ncbi:MAG TPA: protein phosphatase 2C domain-containing protein [Luteolibacter sp.]|nr:protein phosphatase 2C domain-containing protein [Luteolibacter sp.]